MHQKIAKNIFNNINRKKEQTRRNVTPTNKYKPKNIYTFFYIRRNNEDDSKS